MSNVNPLFSPLESMQLAWGLKLRDFRQWSSPRGQQSIRDWKTRQLEGSIIVAKSSMMDDTEAMLRAVQENNNARAIGDKTNSGTSVYLPVMITAISGIESPPDRDVVIDHPNWANVVISNDPLQRVVQMRTASSSYRCQIAFFSPDPHAASAIANQFVSFWKHEGKRGVDVHYDIGFAGVKVIKDKWNFRVVENTLYPDKIDVGMDNIYGASVDCIIVGVEPTVVGLGGLDDDITDTGEPDGSIPPKLPPVEGNRDPADQLNSFVIEADIIERSAKRHTRVAIDADTGVITESNIKDDAP
ncbi:hypothetical protein [Psychrobacter sp. W2-37-MNA-CIBAN-0211]|uniref:hypothetical protein n=1 Tax=Psychrobacter sp. W2-37-MNA-CIBAN-0211 TaxID=3140443 RepID=UPI00332F9752